MPYEKKNNVYIQTSISIHIFIVAQICTYVVDIRSFNILPRVQHPSDWYGLAICCYSTRISFCKYSHSAAIYWIGITSGWSLRKCWPTARLRTPYSQTGMHCGLYRVDSSQDKTRQDKPNQSSKWPAWSKWVLLSGIPCRAFIHLLLQLNWLHFTAGSNR